MQKAVEVLLFVGILVNLIKAGELSLRAHQQKKMQEKLEHWVLVLDYKRPIDWFLKRQTVDIIFYYLLSIVGIITGLLDIFVLTGTRPGKVFSALAVTLFCYCLYSGMVPRVIKHFSTDWNPGKEKSLKVKTQRLYLQWIARGESFFQRIIRLVVTAVSSFIVTVVGFSFGWYLYQFIRLNISNRSSSFILTLCFFALSGARIFIAWWNIYRAHITLGINSFLIILLSILILILELTLKFIRGLTWRIVEFNKGAFAAIVILITALLSALEAYLKYYK